MNSKTDTVLIVDDSIEDVNILMSNLANHYAVVVATSGEKALQRAEREPRPDVILMDVVMPGLNGYETCHQLKAQPQTADIDIIFVSAHDTTQEKLAGYDAGGSDYIIKPIDPAELLRKIQIALRNRDRRRALEFEKGMAMDMAKTAMSSVGDLSLIVQFLRDSFNAANAVILGQLVEQCLAGHGLETCLSLRCRQNSIYLGSNEPLTPLEVELLNRAQTRGSLVEHGKRLITQRGGTVLLVKNFPIENPDLCGRLRDSIALLLDCADSKLQNLELALLENKRREELRTIVGEANAALVAVEKVHQEHKAANLRVMDEIVGRLQNSFLHLGLTDHQESELLDIVQTGAEQTHINLEKGTQVEAQLKAITFSLQRCLNGMENA